MGEAPSVFLLCSTCFQPQSHLKVQHGCWSSSHHVHFPGSRKEEGPKRYSSQVNWFTSRDFLKSPVQHSPFTSCDPPEFLWCLNWNCIEFITRYEKCYHLNISPSGKLSQATYTFEINCIVSIDQTRHLSKKYNKNAHCLFYALI